MEVKRYVLYEGVEARGLGSATEQIKEKFGIDVNNNDFYEIEYEGATDDNGISDEIYTKYRLVRVIPLVDIDIDIDPPHIVDIPGEDTEEQFTEEDKLEIDSKIQDMLAKYYGDSGKKEKYKKNMKRFKSHIVEKKSKYVDEYGNTKEIRYKTIEDYPERHKDENFLQLEEYAYRLERLSRAEAGDIRTYKSLAIKDYETAKKEILKKIISIGDSDKILKRSLEIELDEMERGREEYITNKIYMLQQKDQDYLVTNNYAYNQHLSTQTNLLTLGKYGEKVPFLKMSKGITPKSIVQNAGKGIANIFILGRNYTTAPLNKAIGTYVAAPIHRILFDSEKNVSGVYKNLGSHRYTARKDFFINKYLEDLKEENISRREKGLSPKKPSILKMTFGTRLDAIRHYKEGNSSVTSAAAHDIIQDEKRIKIEKKQKEAKKVYYSSLEQDLLKQIQKIDEQIKALKNGDEKYKEFNEKERLAWESAKCEATKNLLKVQDEIDQNKNMQTGIIQTDAISMEQHDKANKSNMTKVISGFKGACRLASMKFLGQSLSRNVTERTTKRVHVPEKTITSEKYIPGQINEESLSGIKVSNLVEATKNSNVSYSSVGGNIVDRPEEIFSRGIAINNFDGTGRTISGSDGIGFDILGRTDTKIDITNDTGVFEAIAETMKSVGKDTTSEEIISQIVHSNDPQEALQNLLNDVRVWISSEKEGMPTGWLNVSDAGPSIIKKMKEGHIEKVSEVIPGYTKTVISSSMKRVIDDRIAAIESLLVAGGARELYELARRTKSKEEMKKEGTYTKELEVHQKNNKSEKRDYSNNYGFTGTRRDYKERER